MPNKAYLPLAAFSRMSGRLVHAAIGEHDSAGDLTCAYLQCALLVFDMPLCAFDSVCGVRITLGVSEGGSPSRPLQVCGQLDQWKGCSQSCVTCFGVPWGVEAAHVLDISWAFGTCVQCLVSPSSGLWLGLWTAAVWQCAADSCLALRARRRRERTEV